jgi:hypothetical protein
MSATFDAADLRALANALDHMTETTRQTGVLLYGYDDAHVTHHDHVMRVRWLGGGDSNDRYVLDLPDKDY